MRPNRAMAAAIVFLCLVTLAACRRSDTAPPSGSPATSASNQHAADPDRDDPNARPDEAARAGRSADSLKPADEDYFADMDRGLSRHPEQVRAALPFLGDDALRMFVIGRDNWIVWTAGNDTLWDSLATNGIGTFDLLKTVSSHPSLGYGRNQGANGRFRYLGVMNEPCFDAPKKGDPAHFGLWLDQRRAGCAADPFANEQKYPGIRIGARGQDLHLPDDAKHAGWPKALPVGSYYGEPTGIVGLRLFPNPNFDAAAAAKWDPERYYSDPSYYQDKNLVRPYRIGMSCGFCHVGPNPINPPADPENPTFENLNSNPGAQYFWVDRIFYFDRKSQDTSFVFQLFHSWLPGTLDTSLVSSDNVNNPRTMNAIYALGARLQNATRVGKEQLAGGGLNNKQFTDYPAVAKVLGFTFQPPATVLTPRVLKDGADSVGALGALNRVYLNIGMASDEWTRHFMPLIGPSQKTGPVTPIRIHDLRRVSGFWTANEAQTPAVAAFFLASSRPDYLKDAPGGMTYLKAPAPQLDRGKDVFAERCARCHSTKVPDLPRDVTDGCDGGGNGPNYRTCWDKYWTYTKTDQFKSAMKTLVRQSDFLDGNFLSSERRVPVDLLQTNACSPMATNALRDNIWDNFSSESYKQLPPARTITVYNPVDGTPMPWTPPGGGRGYTRPPSLISLWSTAPYLLNNSVGPFNGDPSVQGRMASFDASIRQMLWPERRRKDDVLGDKVPGYMQRTPNRTYVTIATGYLPDALQKLLQPIVPGLLTAPAVQIGPIPKGTPIGLLANIPLISEDRSLPDRVGHQARLLKIATVLLHDLKDAPRNATDEQLHALFDKAVPDMMAISKCPDFVVNRGHYFGTSFFKEEPGLSDADKDALISFLETL